MDNTVEEVCPDLDFAMHCESINYSAQQIEELLDDVFENNPSLEDVALWLKQVSEVVATLNFAKKQLAQRSAELMDSDTAVLSGIGILQKMPGGSPRKWNDSDRLLSVVFARARDDRRYDKETGEYEPEGEAVMRVLSECARFEWRTGKKRTQDFPGTGLHRLGIDPNDYSSREKAPPIARFVK